jgi:Putative prokaryotic signal transducing protein
MAVATNGLAGWFRREEKAKDEAALQSATTTGGEIEQEPVIVWVAQNQMEAQVIKGRLESEGIPTFIRGEALGAIYGLTTGSLAQTAVFVPAPLAERAQLILQSDENWEWLESESDPDEIADLDDEKT